MVIAHGGCGGSSGGDLEGDGGGSCSMFPSKLLSKSGRKEILNKAVVEAENVKAIKEEVATVKTEQVTLFDDARSVSGGSSCDFELEGEGYDDVLSEGSERKNSGITEKDTIEGVRIKEQVDDAEGGDRCYDGVNGSPSSSSIELPKPIEGLHEVGPPPFLKKTFEMVEDPETDPIVSWSESRDSFVVWDSHEFSKIILPKHFKHSNFSSFIRQLNTYGFRKVDSDRWEFANEGFQGGKKHLLKNIRRRSKYNTLHQGALNSMKPGPEVEVEKLKKDQSILKAEILKLRRQQENSHIQLTNVQERIRCAEMKQYQMLFFLTRMARKPTLVDNLVQKIKRKRELDGIDMVKRRRLLGTQYPVSFPKVMETNPNVDYRHHEQFATLQSEFTGLLSETVNTSMMEPPAPSVSSAYLVMSEKLLGENSVVDEEIDEDVNDSNIYLELEDLISKPLDWVGSASGLVGQTS